MDEIVARWEWRTFGPSFGDADKHFAGLQQEKVEKSDEIYLLSAFSDANVKVRGALVDIKLLERVDAHGLEQWRPLLKAPFPLDAAIVAKTSAALGLPDLPASEGGWSLEHLLDELRRFAGLVRVVNVQKTRSRYLLDGCLAEATDVIADGKPVRTVAIEDATPERVAAAVHTMGLDVYRNINYPRGLKQLIGFATGGKQP
jgi:exopolyphosphatase / guanosine-5'-triphosphate,3'-diphosphate pyrophosphatase